MVNKSFTAPGLVSGWPEIWQTDWPEAVAVCDEDVLSFEAEAHDLIIHALALHWANDPVGQLIQCRRAMKPDGLFLGVMFGGQTLYELRIALAEAEAQVAGGLSPRILPMAEIRDLGALMQRAGFALPVADSVPVAVSYSTIFHLMRDLRAMGEANAMMARLRNGTRRAVFARAGEIYAERFPDTDGRIKATFDMIVLTGWSPDASQPQPLRPGSATARLAEALGTEEKSLKE